jgi:hypothetical protein
MSRSKQHRHAPSAERNSAAWKHAQPDLRSGMEAKPGFAIYRSKGFHITFDNGYTASVQFGLYDYCAKRDLSDGLAAYFERTAASLGSAADETPSATAEIAVIAPDGHLCGLDGWDDEVQGWQTPAQVLTFLRKVAAL